MTIEILQFLFVFTLQILFVPRNAFVLSVVDGIVCCLCTFGLNVINILDIMLTPFWYPASRF